LIDKNTAALVTIFTIRIRFYQSKNAAALIVRTIFLNAVHEKSQPSFDEGKT
jgi:hypothetical protein